MEQSRIAIKTSRGIEFIKVNDIICCIARGRYTKIITKNGKEYLLTKVLKEIEESLPCQIFFRTHKSYLINLNHLVNYQKNSEYAITLENEVKIQLAKRRRRDFHDRIKDLAQAL